LATYAANIAIDVLGLGRLDSLERRVNVLRENFTKINAAAANISAPFQNHIQALERMNTLLVANGRLLEQQANAADRLSRSSDGPARGGRNPNGVVDAKVLEEQRRGWQQQLDLLKQRARALQENTEIMSKLLRAEVELTGTVDNNVRLGKELLKNAKALLVAEEALAKSKAAAEAEQMKNQMWIWQQQQKIEEEKLRAQERYYSERARLAAQAARDEERAEKEKWSRIRNGVNTAGKVGGTVLDALTFGNGAAVAKGAANSAIRGGLAAATVGAGAMQVGADSVLRSIPGGDLLANIGGAMGHGVASMTGPLGVVGEALHNFLSTLGHLPQSLQLATIAAFAFAPAVGGIAAQVVKGLPAIGSLGQALLNLTGISERAQPVMSSLKRSMSTLVSDNAVTSALYGLGSNSMQLPPNAGAFYERTGGTAFSNNLNSALLPKVYDGMLKNIQAEFDARMKVVSAEKSWVQFLKDGAELQKENAKQANLEAAANEIGGKRFAIRSTNVRTQFNSGTAEENAASIAEMRAKNAALQAQIGNPNAYAREALPGGNSLTAQNQYRQLLNDSARLQQAIAAAVEREGKGRLALNAAATFGVSNAEQRLKLQNDINASDQRSITILRERNALLLEEYRAEQRVAAGQLDRASKLASLRNKKAEGEALASRTESVALGVGFPLLFGGGAGSVLGSLAGSFIGSGFGGQILGGAIGTAIDELVTKAEELRKSLADLNAGLPAVGAGMRTTAEDVKHLSERLGLANEEIIKLLESFRLFDSGSARKALAEAFGGVGGFQSADALASITDEKTAIAAIAKLRDEVGLKVAKQALDQLKINGAAGALLVLEDRLIKKQEEKNLAKAKEVTLWDRILAAAITAARPMDSTDAPFDPAQFGKERAEKLTKTRKKEVDEQIQALRDYYKEFEKLQKEFSDKTTNSKATAAKQAAAEQARINEQLMRDQIEIDNAVWNHRRRLLEEERALRRQIAEAEGRIYGLQQTGGGKSGAEIVNQIMSAQRDYQESVLKLKSTQADAMNGLFQAQRGVAATEAGPAPTGSRFKPTQYFTGDPNSPNYRADHGGTANYHDHYGFGTRAEAMAAYKALVAAGIKVTEFEGMGAGVTGPHSGPNSLHMSGLAFDVPGYQWGGSGPIGAREYAGSAKTRSILGMGNSKVVKSQGQVGVAAAGVDAANQGLREQIPLLEKLRGLKWDEIITGITSSYNEQAKAVTDSTASLQLRNRLEMEGVKPEIIDGEVKKAEIYGKAEEQVRALRESLAALGPKTEKNADVFDRFNQAINATESGSRAAAAAVDANTQALLQQKIPAFELAKTYGDLQVELERLSDPAANIINAAGSISAAFDNTFTAITTGTVTAQQAFAQFTQSLAANFMKMATQMIAKWIEMKIIGLAMNFFPMAPFSAPATTGLGSNFSSAIGNETGISWGSALGFRAAGGPVSSNSPYIVGEKGPELFVPSSSGRIIPNNSLAGGTTNVVVNVDATGTNVQGDAAQAKQLGAVVSMAVQAELIKQKRPGGILA
jgi:hypothetical protein